MGVRVGDYLEKHGEEFFTVAWVWGYRCVGEKECFLTVLGCGVLIAPWSFAITPHCSTAAGFCSSSIGRSPGRFYFR